jgi:hypothetical protein
MLKRLDKPPGRAKIPSNFGRISLRSVRRTDPGFMNSTPPPQPPDKKSTVNECKHPRVQVVSRDEDSEFVECLECREVFESSEFKDMRIEETKLKNQL